MCQILAPGFPSGFQDGEEMRLVETVVSFDRMVGLDYLAVVRILPVGTDDWFSRTCTAALRQSARDNR